MSRKDHSADLWSIRVRPEEPLSFKPGQYATLGLEHGAKVIQKAYSIVSSPLEDELEFFFELVPNGELTPLLYELGVGDSMWMRRQARGLFVLDQASGHAKHFLLCTVTGVAPYVSMARTLARGEPAADNLQIVLIQAASRSWEFAYREELAALSHNAGWLRYIPCVSRPWEDAAWKGEVGRVEDIARKYLDELKLDPSETTAYLCGHPQMIENCKGILQRRGFPKESVREEIYWIPTKPSKAQVTA
ncbi:MAG TPA: ferredoxin--NADP reductase [Terriglobia bacterium]|nr:ferredoxin--NADP reductase [Terriglobia bacterium]